jgi:hypothetical protein
MFSTEIDTARKFAVHKPTRGTVRLADVLSAALGLFAHADFEPEFSVIWDLRDCAVDITLQEIIDLSPKIIEKANAARPHGKTAWIASSAMGEAIIRLLYDQHPWSAEWQTFSTLDGAIAWCRATSLHSTG